MFSTVRLSIVVVVAMVLAAIAPPRGAARRIRRDRLGAETRRPAPTLLRPCRYSPRSQSKPRHDRSRPGPPPLAPECGPPRPDCFSCRVLAPLHV